MFRYSLIFTLIGFAYSWPYPDGRIVGGHNVTIEELPYQVSLVYHSYHSCGGAIIAENAILTAAHCVTALDKSFLQIRVGSTFRTHSGDLIEVDSIHINKNFTISPVSNDIAVILLKQHLVFGSGVKAIRLAETGASAKEGMTAIVSGWGTLYWNGPQADVLQAVEVPIVDHNDCNNSYGYGKVTDSMICAGYIDEGGKDACQNDSGGPLAINGVLFGIVSWGGGCGQPAAPGVYTSVAFEREWIDGVLRED